MLKKRYILLCSVFLTIVALFAVFPDVVSAANLVDLDAEDTKTVAKIKNSFSVAMGDNFAGDLSNLFLSFQHIARIIVVIMTAMAGMMIAFGLGGASQMFIKWIFGVGVALNIADFGWSFFGDDYWVDTSSKENGSKNSEADKNLDNITKIHTPGEKDTAWYDIFSQFMGYYIDAFINPAYARLMPIAVKMTMVLWFIDTSMKVALGLTQQDLINFFTKQILKLGIYIFLITNWWSPIGSSQAQKLSQDAGGSMQIMAVLGNGFESLGYYAAGADSLKNSKGEKIEVKPDSIVKNTMSLWSAMWASLQKEKSNEKNNMFELGLKMAPENVRSMINAARGLLLFFDMIWIFMIVGVLLYIALELFIVRVEFYTMAVLTVMLLPFAMIDQLKFLADKAISLMFNLALKCFIMAFLTVGAVKVTDAFISKAKDNEGFLNWWADFTVIIQMLLLCTILALIVKKAPQLCNGLLSGNPSLSGGDLKQELKQTISTTMKVAGTTAAAVVTVGGATAAGGLSAGAKALLRGAVKYPLTQNSFSQSFSQGMNLFSGNAQGSAGLMQKGGLSQALGLSDVQGKGLVDRMKGDTGDKSKDGDKNGNSSTSNNNNQNQPQMAAQSNTGGEKTIEKQIGTVSEKLDRIEKILNSGGGNGGTNPSGNNPPNNSGNSGNPANNAQYDKMPNVTAGTSPTPPTQTFNTTGNQNPQTNQTVVTNTKTDISTNSNSDKNNPKK